MDEQYHSLLHLNAARVMQDNRRPWTLDSRALPLSDFVARHHVLRTQADHEWQRDLIQLAFSTVVEVAIGGYLELAAKDKDIQPVNSATAAIHWRDEECHGSIAAEFATGVFESLDADRQRYFMAMMVEAARQFSEKDFTLWHAIADLVDAPGHMTPSRRPTSNRVRGSCAATTGRWPSCGPVWTSPAHWTSAGRWRASRGPAPSVPEPPLFAGAPPPPPP